MKRFIALFICVVVVMSLIVPVSAASRASNGYNSKSITYNNKPYTVTLSTLYSTTYGAYLKATCQAAIEIRFHNLSVEYDTYSYGYVTNTGGAKQAWFTETKHTIYSYYVPCSRGMDQVIEYRSINGSANFYASSTPDTLSVSAW